MKKSAITIVTWCVCILTLVVPFSAAFIGEVNSQEAETETRATEEISSPVESTADETIAEPITERVVPETIPESTVSETIPETTPETTELAEQTYAVPLDIDLQKHIISECELMNIDPAIVFAMIKTESGYKADAMGDKGKAYGLMQIHLRWHSDRMAKLGCTDLLDPYQNVTVGINYLSELLKYYGDIGLALTAYNGGYSYANKYKAKGEVSNYAKVVLTEAERIGE